MILELRMKTNSPARKIKDEPANIVFDSCISQQEITIPSQFIWPEHEKPSNEPPPPLVVPVIDLKAFLSGDPSDLSRTLSIVEEACKKYGLFFLVNHGIDYNLMNEAKENLNSFFEKSIAEKQRAQRKAGENYGYSSNATQRFSSKLPWKETLSIPNCDAEIYITSVLGEEFRQFGKVYQKYCDEMSELSLKMTEVLGMSLGVEGYFREYFQGHDSVLRLNYYPSCKRPDQTLGHGPHCDPVALTVLYPDENVSGLQVHVDGKWHFVPPKPGAFVINLGDIFRALSNGIYKSCKHRVVVNNQKTRISMGFFMSPSSEKVVKPPQQLLSTEKKREYPDFTWQSYLKFTQSEYRPDLNTLDAFVKWHGGNRGDMSTLGAS